MRSDAILLKLILLLIASVHHISPFASHPPIRIIESTMSDTCGPDCAHCKFFRLLGAPGYPSARDGYVFEYEYQHEHNTSPPTPISSSASDNEPCHPREEELQSVPAFQEASVYPSPHTHIHKAARKGHRIPERYADAIRLLLQENPLITPTPALGYLTDKFFIRSNVAPADWPGDERIKRS